MAKKVLTERDILNAVKSGQKSIVADAHTILTPAAQDAVRSHRLTITDKVEKPKEQQPQNSVSYQRASISQVQVGNNLIVIGSDHGGYRTKELVKKYIAELGYQTLDVGTNSEEACDFPDYAYAVARIVAKGEAWRGIMIDATGVASSIVCNKIPGVRAVACYNEFVAQSSREHNDANVLTLGAKALGDATIKSIIKIWLETWFGGGRHKKRVDKISDIEKKFSK